MHGLIATFLVAGLAAAPGPSPEDAARSVARGDARAAESMRILLRKGRFGLKALLKVARSVEGDSRRRCFEAVGSFRGDKAEAALLEGLRGSDIHSQLGAVRGLSKMGGKSVVEPLLGMAISPDQRIRNAVIEGLLKIGKPAEPEVRKLLRDRSANGREVALRFMARFLSGGKQVAIIGAALRDPAPQVRLAAIEMAELWRDASLADNLTALSRDRDPEVGARAVEAVAKFPSLRAALPQLLSDPQVSDRAWLTAFHRMRDYDDMAIPYLIVAISKASDKRKAIMIDLLVSDHSNGELSGFVKMLEKEDADTLGVTTELLGKLGAKADAAAAQMVVGVRENLADAIKDYLRSRPRGGVTDELIAGAKEGTVDERVKSIDILGELSNEEVRGDLVDLLDDTETQVRVAAARALGGLDDVGAEAELVRLLEDNKKEVRLEAIKALRAYDSRLSALARMSAMEDKDDEVRKEAIKSFEGDRRDKVLDALIEKARRGNQQEKLMAIVAISEIKTPRAAIVLVELVTDKDQKVREAAQAFISTLPPLPSEEAEVATIKKEAAPPQVKAPEKKEAVAPEDKSAKKEKADK